MIVRKYLRSTKAFYINLLFDVLKNMQKVQHWQFWDHLEINANKEDTESAELKAFNFQWTSHVDDIETPSLVSASAEAEVINADIVPDLRDEDVGNHGEEFDNLFIYFSSCSDFSSSDEEKACQVMMTEKACPK